MILSCGMGGGAAGAWRVVGRCGRGLSREGEGRRRGRAASHPGAKRRAVTGQANRAERGGHSKPPQKQYKTASELPAYQVGLEELVVDDVDVVLDEQVARQLGAVRRAGRVKLLFFWVLRVWDDGLVGSMVDG